MLNKNLWKIYDTLYVTTKIEFFEKDDSVPAHKKA
jgi:hypothetical protein